MHARPSEQSGRPVNRVRRKKRRVFRYNYKIRVFDGCKSSVRKEFELCVHRTLAETRGWRRYHYRFQHCTGQCPNKRTFTISLVPNELLARFGQSFDGMSAADCLHNQIFINLDRWKNGSQRNGSTRFELNVEEYRRYVINHEVGHILKGCQPSDHKTDCDHSDQGKAPVMMQQTISLRGCKSNHGYPTNIDRPVQIIKSKTALK